MSRQEGLSYLFVTPHNHLSRNQKHYFCILSLSFPAMGRSSTDSPFTKQVAAMEASTVVKILFLGRYNCKLYNYSKFYCYEVAGEKFIKNQSFQVSSFLITSSEVLLIAIRFNGG